MATSAQRTNCRPQHAFGHSHTSPVGVGDRSRKCSYVRALFNAPRSGPGGSCSSVVLVSWEGAEEERGCRSQAQCGTATLLGQLRSAPRHRVAQKHKPDVGDILLESKVPDTGVPLSPEGLGSRPCTGGGRRRPVGHEGVGPWGLSREKPRSQWHFIAETPQRYT